MPVCSAVPVELTASERHRLKKMAYGHKTPHQARQRATIVLLAARGRGNARIAAETHLHVDTVRRWLKDDAPKPWQHRSWIFIRDPNFRATAQRVLDLCARTFDSVPLGEDEYVISADEKTSIQARCRCHPTLAAYDIHRARLRPL
ncbi:helix-turn-helix domain-containing protein [Streptomyces sp. NPDC050509]|uniref:helix-turn-helix domain-containing protein n=1 Tax=Streptomyces sp. NPDC050509 TaxID=3365620 RepID=UPI00378C1ECA